eukprot:5080507-Amphidinium_carterae.1
MQVNGESGQLCKPAQFGAVLAEAFLARGVVSKFCVVKVMGRSLLAVVLLATIAAFRACCFVAAPASRALRGAEVAAPSAALY